MIVRILWLFRGLQWLVAIAILVVNGLSSPARRHQRQYVLQLSSSVQTFVAIGAYSTLLYVSCWLFGRICLQKRLLSLFCHQVVDFLLAFCMFTAAIAISASDYYLHCATYRMLLRCPCIRASLFLCLALMVLLLITLMLSVNQDDNVLDQDDDDLYANASGSINIQEEEQHSGRPVIGETPVMMVQEPSQAQAPHLPRRFGFLV